MSSIQVVYPIALVAVALCAGVTLAMGQFNLVSFLVFLTGAMLTSFLLRYVPSRFLRQSPAERDRVLRIQRGEAIHKPEMLHGYLFFCHAADRKRVAAWLQTHTTVPSAA